MTGEEGECSPSASLVQYTRYPPHVQSQPNQPPSCEKGDHNNHHSTGGNLPGRGGRPCWRPLEKICDGQHMSLALIRKSSALAARHVMIVGDRWCSSPAGLASNGSDGMTWRWKYQGKKMNCSKTERMYKKRSRFDIHQVW